MSCRAVGEESVGGSAATVYEAKGKTEIGNSESKMWIAKGSGLLLKDEETIRDGKETLIQRTAHYEYAGVHAPI
jgi:outer membrane lipoprotein-sorting protein